MLPDGRVGIVIGDVGGRGMDAAATMGQIRNALRAYALKADGPAAVIDDLHALVAASRGRDHVRHGRLRRARPRDRRGRAGQRRPPARRCSPAAATSTRRAARRSASAAPAACQLGRFTLAPGETLWLFTDGLIESRRRTLDAGLDELEQAAARATGSLDEIADRLVAELPAARDDDIALLGLRRLGEVR